jgi:hypothetical protein
VYGYSLNEKGEIPDEHVEILAADVENKRRSGNFFIKLSRDRSKMLLLHSAPHKKTAEDKWVVNLRVLTPSLFTIKEMEEEFPWIRRSKTNDEYTISSYAISNEGGAYVAIRKRGWDRRAKLYITKDMTVYMYDPANGFEVREIPVDLGDKAASSILLDIDREGNLVGGGFYGERTPRGMFKYEGIKGSYYVKINRVSEEVEVATTEDFTQEFTAKILKEKQAAKGKLVPNNFIPRKIILKEGGGAVIIAEYFEYVFIQNNNGSSSERWFHGPVVVVSIDENGNQEWVRAIPKNQIYVKTNLALGIGGVGWAVWITIPTGKNKSVYHSFLVGISGENIHLVYNDNPKNIELTHFRDTKALTGFNKAIPVSVIISADGEVKKEILADRDRKQVVLRPKIYFQDDFDKVIIYGNKRSKDKFGLISF